MFMDSKGSGYFLLQDKNFKEEKIIFDLRKL